MKPVQKPISNKPTSCNEVSSTCVTWDGPALSFACMNIEICKGDSINVALYELFKMMCVALEKTDISLIDSTCLFDLPSEPNTLEELLNLIIRKLCDQDIRVLSLEDVENRTYSANLPYCLQNINDVLTVTKLPIDEYFNKIASKICSINTETDAFITRFDEIILTELPALETEINSICGTPQNLLVTPICSVTPPDPILVTKALEALESVFCSYKNFTGTPSELAIALTRDCPDLGNLPALSNAGILSDIYGWIDNPINVAQSINNLWLTICDMRAAIRNVLVGCCNFSPCLSFDIFYTLQFEPIPQPTYVDIIFNDGVYPPPSPMPGLNGPQTIVRSLDRLSNYVGSGLPPAWIAADFPTIGNVIITIDDGSGEIIVDTGFSIVALMFYNGTTNFGTYRFFLPSDFDMASTSKSIKIEFDYRWDNPSPPVPGGTSCDDCGCCCTYSIINGIY